MTRWAIAKCVNTAHGRCWLEPQECAGLEDGRIVIDWLKRQSEAWLVLGVIRQEPGGLWETVELWEAESHEERRKSYRRKRTVH